VAASAAASNQIVTTVANHNSILPVNRFARSLATGRARPSSTPPPELMIIGSTSPDALAIVAPQLRPPALAWPIAAGVASRGCGHRRAHLVLLDLGRRTKSKLEFADWLVMVMLWARSGLGQSAATFDEQPDRYSRSPQLGANKPSATLASLLDAWCPSSRSMPMGR